MCGLGLMGIVSPESLVRFARLWQRPGGLWLAAAIRIVLGVAMLMAAPESRAPLALRILGVFIIIAGVITPFYGMERFSKMLNWWATRSVAFKRAWASVALLFGVFLIYVVVP